MILINTNVSIWEEQFVLICIMSVVPILEYLQSFQLNVLGIVFFFKQIPYPWLNLV